MCTGKIQSSHNKGRKSNEPEASFQMLPRNKRKDFDDYFGGPTLEDMTELQRPGGLEPYPNGWDVALTIWSPWELFKNYGYTLEPEFALMFNQQDPLHAEVHLLPIGEPDSPAVADDEDKVSGCEVMGMGEMLACAPVEGSLESMNMFVQGFMPDEQTMIKLDPTRDLYPLRQDEHYISLDIDSVIWVTYYPKILTKLSIHLLPYSGAHPPIWKCNHAYMEVLMPQLEEDQDSSSRREWFFNRKSLSAIPHIHFGKLGHRSMSFEISVMFLRMMHKKPISGRSVTLILFEVQSLWFTDILYPTILAGENPSTVPYKDYTLSEWQWKASVNERFTGKDKLVVVQGRHVPKLAQVMQDIVNSDPEEYGRYGSLVFAYEFCGIKSSTNIVLELCGDPYAELCQKFPDCDWEYMQKRKNGQLLMDFGMCFHHPNPDDKTPLVFLWDIKEVNASYDAAGMNAGKQHHAGMIGQYGGRQVEMEQKHLAIVQFCFCSTYSLNYETF